MCGSSRWSRCGWRGMQSVDDDAQVHFLQSVYEPTHAIVASRPNN
jgi:hypothetical protein